MNWIEWEVGSASSGKIHRPHLTPLLLTRMNELFYLMMQKYNMLVLMLFCHRIRDITLPVEHSPPARYLTIIHCYHNIHILLVVRRKHFN